MNPNISAISIDDIKEVLPKLSRQQIIALDQELHGYLETSILTWAGTLLKEKQLEKKKENRKLGKRG